MATKKKLKQPQAVDSVLELAYLLDLLFNGWLVINSVTINDDRGGTGSFIVTWEEGK